MKIRSLSLGKKAISEEAIRGILAAVVLIIFLIAARSFGNSFITNHDPNAVESEASFLKVVEEVNKIIP